MTHPERPAVPGKPAAGGPTPRGRGLLQMWRLAGPYWSSPGKWKIRGATSLLLLLTIAQVAISVWGSYWNRDLFDALEARSVSGVLVQVAVFALIFAVSIGVTAAHLLAKRWLQLDWRRWLTEQLVGRWMESGRHYRLALLPGEHDNPDQRIAEDIRIATESAVALAHTLVFSLLSLGLFVDILWSVSGAMRLPGTTIEVPGYMVPLAFVYAGVGTLAGWLVARPLVRSTNVLQSAEADFRFGLARDRERSEAIALMHGEPLERAGSAQRFAQIVRGFDRQSLAYLGLVSFSTGYGGLLPVFPILVAAPQYIAGAMSLGVLMQAAQAFQRLTSALSWPVDNVGEIARCRASADRVLSLHADLKALDGAAAGQGQRRIEVGQSPRRHLEIEKLCIAEPSGLILLANFSADVRAGERVLVTGDPDVTGALVKVIGGLWPSGSGRVLLPADDHLLVMTARPFLADGPLRQALSYPRPADAFDDRDIRHALECAGLAWLAPRLDEHDNWEHSLPLRAQQQLGFARAILHRPPWIVMDDATDAFDPKGQRLILEMLHRELPDSALLLVTSHPGLEPLFHRKIVLNRVAGEHYLPAGAPGL
jgi:vitamin B12/bleomycin/antimicrobial peptide transport system ATP-binding/permease protein